MIFLENGSNKSALMILILNYLQIKITISSKFQNRESRTNCRVDHCKILEFLAERFPEHPFPQVIKSRSGDIILLTEINGKVYLVRVYTWLEGDLLRNCQPTTEMYFGLGSLLGRLDSELLEFKSEISTFIRRVYYWDLQYALLSRSLTKYITDPKIRRIVEYFYQQFESFVLPKIPMLRKGIIHSDANDYNILVSGKNVSGLIDFGDAAYSSIINELAIAISYAALEKGRSCQMGTGSYKRV